MLEHGHSAKTLPPTLHASSQSLAVSPIHHWRAEIVGEAPRSTRSDASHDRASERRLGPAITRPQPVYQTAKRALDIVVAAAAIIILSPLMIAITLAIRLTSRGPAIYRHTRVGFQGREFSCYKFRSMVDNADRLKHQLRELNQHEDDRTFKMAADPRITPVGRILRKSSLDELPQLFNVLLGDMSLVGPRPPVPGEVEKYSWDDLRRLEVKPGLTCIWQVSGRSNIPFPQQLQMDIEYIEQQSMLLDLKLLVQTVPAVLTANGAC